MNLDFTGLGLQPHQKNELNRQHRKALEKLKDPPRPSEVWTKQDWIIFYNQIKYLL